MKLPKYKLLVTLLLKQRWNTNHNQSLLKDSDFLSSLLGPNYSSIISRLKLKGLIGYGDSSGSQTLRMTTGKSSRHPEMFGAKSSLGRDPDRRSGDLGLVITYQGVNDLLLRFPILDYFDKSWFDPTHHGWSEKLTLVVFNINEENRKIRDRLRYNLKALGFGRLNRSLYLSPYLSVKEAGHLFGQRLPESAPAPAYRQAGARSDSGSQNLEGFAFSVPYESLKELLKNSHLIWDLDEVADLYERALSYWEVSGSKYSQVPSEVLGKFWSKFLEALLIDPLLPIPLLPKSWPGKEALEIAKNCIIG